MRFQVLSFSRQYPSFLFPGKTQDEERPPAIPVEATPLIDTIDPISWQEALFPFMNRM